MKKEIIKDFLIFFNQLDFSLPMECFEILENYQHIIHHCNRTCFVVVVVFQKTERPVFNKCFHLQRFTKFIKFPAAGVCGVRWCQNFGLELLSHDGPQWRHRNKKYRGA